MIGSDQVASVLKSVVPSLRLCFSPDKIVGIGDTGLRKGHQIAFFRSDQDKEHIQVYHSDLEQHPPV